MQTYRLRLDLCIWMVELPVLGPLDINHSVNDGMGHMDALGPEFSRQ